MATVYLAQDLKHDRKVAVKVLRPELAAVIGAERFLSEIKTTANLQHPHILPLFDSGEADSFLFYVMPYVQGETVRDRIAREKQLPDRRRGADRLRSGRGPRLRAPARRHPPRHQARKHPAARRIRPGGRFRHRAGRQQGRRRAHDRNRHEPRHAALHEPRAGDGRAGDHRPLRCVRAGLRALRDAPRRAALHRPHRTVDRGQGDDRRARRLVAPAEVDSARGRGRGAHGAGEASGGSVRLRRGIRGGTRRRIDAEREQPINSLPANPPCCPAAPPAVAGACRDDRPRRLGPVAPADSWWPRRL